MKRARTTAAIRQADRRGDDERGAGKRRRASLQSDQPS